MSIRQRLRQTLAGQQFPAQRWELIATAEAYGADSVTLKELQDLPPMRFHSLADVSLAVERRPNYGPSASAASSARLAEHAYLVVHGLRTSRGSGHVRRRGADAAISAKDGLGPKRPELDRPVDGSDDQVGWSAEP